MTVADWYFDFISPFAYLQFETLAQFPPELDITFMFWGFDATGMVGDYVREPQWFGSADMTRISDLPAAAHRT